MFARGTVGVPGVTASDTRFALLTVRLAGALLNVPRVAVILAEPWATPVANP